jgi:5-(carboxyamino)imidazole ribonucleotide mutase
MFERRMTNVTKDAELQVAIIMGSKSDWETMRPASDTLHDFGVAHECKILSAHRTPTQLTEYMTEAETRGCQVFIGGAGGAAHLPGVMAAQTLRPVLGVPIESKLQGLDSLLSIVQMPSGIPVGTLAIGSSGATNAALLAIAILGNSEPELQDKIQAYRDKRAEKILKETLPYKGSSAGLV